MMPTRRKFSSPHPLRRAWTLTELLVVMGLFLVASVMLLMVFNRQGSFSQRSVTESLKNTLREVALREMESKVGNGYILLERNVQGFTHVQGGREPYRISTPQSTATNTDSAGAQTTFTLAIDRYEPTGYEPLENTLANEELTLVYYPEGKNETAAASNSPDSPFAIDIPRSSLGTRTVFYLKKDNQPVSNQVIFYFYDPKNILSDDSEDSKPSLQSGPTTIQRLQIGVNRLGNFSLVDDTGTNNTTYSFQLRVAGSDVGPPANLPSDIW